MIIVSTTTASHASILSQCHCLMLTKRVSRLICLFCAESFNSACRFNFVDNSIIDPYGLPYIDKDVIYIIFITTNSYIGSNININDGTAGILIFNNINIDNAKKKFHCICSSFILYTFISIKSTDESF